MTDNTDNLNILDEKRAKHLSKAEWVDAWRIFPRLFVLLYGFLVSYVVLWFISIKTYVTTQCDVAMITTLMEKGLSFVDAKTAACTIIAVVGGPTTQHAALVTTICGLATVIFGFYTNSGRDWSKSVLPWKFGKSKKDKEKEE